MKIDLNALVGLAGIGLLAYVAYHVINGTSSAMEAVSSGLSKTSEAVNPANRENIVNRMVSAVGGQITAVASGDTGPGMNADGSWSFGAWLYDITHDDPLKTAR